MILRPPVADIVCPVCGHEANWMQLHCPSCGAALRDRVPTLQLFATIWQLFVDARGAMMRISRSEQKNYVYLLFPLEGPVLATCALWVAHAGDGPLDYGSIALLQWGGGFLIGLLFGPVLALVASKLAGARRSAYRLWAALAAYGMLPLALATVIVLPLQMAVFGRELFSTNPWPFSYDPASFWVLAALAAVAYVLALFWWSMALRLHVSGGLRRLAALLLMPVGHACCVALCAELFAHLPV